MWFGDLVTMKWWDDLWLNESFAEWACYHAAVEATEFTEAWTGFTNARKNWAYRQDQLPSTHPIAADNHDLEAVEVNFDGITYAKGASVLKQLVAWVGMDDVPGRPAAVLQGPRLRQLRVHRPAARAGEVVRAASWTRGPRSGCRPPASTPSPRRSSSTPTAPTPPSRSCRPRAPDYPTLRRHRIGIGLYDEEDGHLVRRYHLEVDIEGELTDVAELVGQPQPDLVLLNDGDLTYAKIRLDERSLATVIGGLARLDDSLARALCWGAAWDMTRDAEMSATDFVELVLRNIGSETDAFGSRRIPGYAAQATSRLLRPRATAPRCSTDWESGLRELLRPPSPAATTSYVRPCLRRRRAHRPGARRPRGPARRDAGDRRPGRGHGPAVGAGDPPGPHRPLRRRRRSPPSCSATTPSPVRRTPPRRWRPAPPPRPRPRPGSRRRCRRTSPTRRTGRSAWRSCGTARRTCWRRTSTSTSTAADDIWDRLGTHKASPPWSTCSPSRWPAPSCWTGSTPGSSRPPPTPPPSATCARVATTWPARSRAGEGRPGLTVGGRRASLVPVALRRGCACVPASAGRAGSRSLSPPECQPGAVVPAPSSASAQTAPACRRLGGAGVLRRAWRSPA